MSGTRDPDPVRPGHLPPAATPPRAATAQEARALAHPLRIRILNVTQGEPSTNKEIAARLGELPGTTLHHIRVLTETGFLQALPPRAGRRGAREVPYRPTGKSWVLSFRDVDRERMAVGTAITDDAYGQYTESDPAGRFAESQVSLRLTVEDARDLADRLHGLVDEYRRTRQTPEGRPISLMWAFFEPAGAERLE